MHWVGTPSHYMQNTPHPGANRLLKGVWMSAEHLHLLLGSFSDLGWVFFQAFGGFVGTQKVHSGCRPLQGGIIFDQVLTPREPHVT